METLGREREPAIPGGFPESAFGKDVRVPKKCTILLRLSHFLKSPQFRLRGFNHLATRSNPMAGTVWAKYLIPKLEMGIFLN